MEPTGPFAFTTGAFIAIALVALFLFSSVLGDADLIIF